MDFDDTEEEAAFRAEVRAWMKAHARERDPGQLSTSHSFYDFDDIFVKEGKIVATPHLRRRVCRDHLAGRVRWSGRHVRRSHDLPPGRGEVRRGLEPVRRGHRHGGPDHHRPRHRRATPPVPARPCSRARRSGASCSASPARAPTWPACRPGPCGTATSGSSTARRCGARARTTPTWGSCWPAPTPTLPKHRGHHLLPPRHAQPGCRGATAAPDDRWRDVQRGLLHRCAGAGGQRGRRGQRRLAGHHDHAGQRAQLRAAERRAFRRSSSWPVNAGRPTIPLMRQRLAHCFISTEISRYLGFRIQTALSKGMSSPETSVAKLLFALSAKETAELTIALQGPAGHADGDAAPGQRLLAAAVPDVRRPSGSPRGATRSSATSSASGCSGCPATSGPTRTWPFKDLVR